MIALPPPFLCVVVGLHDGDGPIYCANGIEVRTAGVQSPDYEDAPPCRRPSHPAYVCDNVAAERAKVIVAGLVLHQTMTCQPVDRSWKRVVAPCTLPDGRSLSCATIAAGAGVKWDRYWRKYRMGECQ